MKRVALLLCLLMLVTFIASAEDSGWKIREYVDEFDLPTGKLYLESEEGTGTFSNSVADKEKLTAYVLCEVDNYHNTIFIQLTEYDQFTKSNTSSSTEYYDIAVRDVDGTKHTFSGYMPAKSKYIYFDKNNYSLPGAVGATNDNDQAATLLYHDGIIYFSIVQRDNPLNKYVFSINTTGFGDQRGNLIGKPYSLSVGMAVIHKTKGEGRITLIYCMNNVVKATVDFGDQGTETFVIPSAVNDGILELK